MKFKIGDVVIWCMPFSYPIMPSSWHNHICEIVGYGNECEYYVKYLTAPRAGRNLIGTIGDLSYGEARFRKPIYCPEYLKNIQ